MKNADYGIKQIAALSDRDLIAATSFWRTKAIHDGVDAHEVLGRLDDEMKRRFGGVTTMPADFDDAPRGDAGRPWWKLR